MKFAVAIRLFVTAVLLMLLPGAWGQTAPVLTTLHNFTGTGTDGASPDAGLVLGSDGNLYGTTYIGGSSNAGTIFSTTPAGAFTTLHSFTGADGANPQAGLVQGGSLFYGVTYKGGANNDGEAFSITPAGGFTPLHDFTIADGISPLATLVPGGVGTFYGTADGGGSTGNGTVFSITSAGTVSVLYNFTDVGTDSAVPYAGLVADGSGLLYGTTISGSNSNGTVFSIATTGGSINVLHGFNGTDGDSPYGGLVRGSNGLFYGTTYQGGSNNLGTVFSIDSAGTFNTLHNFSGNGADGASPFAALIQGSDGNFYGTTEAGGSYGNGTVFSMTTAGAVTLLHSFSGNGPGTDGQYPAGALVEDAAGNFYGTTSSGGPGGQGTVFRLAMLPAGALQFAPAAYTVNENAGSVSLTVSRVGGSAGAASVSYASADGTALAGRDYQAVSGTLNWANGDATDRAITVPLIDRHLAGGTVAFAVSLNDATGGATLGAAPTATVSIADSDPASPPTPTPTPTASPVPTPTAAPLTTVAIVSPPDNITVVAGSALPLAASVDDITGRPVASVQFLLNGSPVDTTTVAPYVFNTTAPATPGVYAIDVVATDASGNATRAPGIVLNVIAINAAAAPPTAGLLTPLDGLNLAAASTVTLSAQAAAAASTSLDHVSIYADGGVIATFDGQGNLLTSAHGGNGAPARQDASSMPLGGTLFTANYTLPAADKLLSVLVVAFDKLGQATLSGAASVHSTVTTDRAPVVAITSLGPTARVLVGSVNTVLVSASDPDAGNTTGVARQDASANATLAQLAYYINGANLAKVTAPPYSFSFSPPAAGLYLLHAVATDGSGLSTVSEPVVVRATTPPTVNVLAAGGGRVVVGQGNGKFVVSRTGDLSAALTVAYKARGAAVAGVDYKPLPGSVTIPAGAASAKVKVKPIGGSPDHGTLKLKFVLKPAADGSYELGSDGKATLQLQEAD